MKLLLPSSTSQTALPGSWHQLSQVGQRLLSTTAAAEIKDGKKSPECSDSPQVRGLSDLKHIDPFSQFIQNRDERCHRVMLVFFLLQEVGMGGKIEENFVPQAALRSSFFLIAGETQEVIFNSLVKLLINYG